MYYFCVIFSEAFGLHYTLVLLLLSCELAYKRSSCQGHIDREDNDTEREEEEKRMWKLDEMRATNNIQ